jgi:hypothetical protein
MKVILWTGREEQAVPVRDAIRKAGHVCMIRNANFFGGTPDAETCDAIAFHATANRDRIIASYRSEYYVERTGIHVRILDIETGEFGEPISVPTLPPPPPPAPTEADLLDGRLENMSYEDLRQYVKGVTGAEPPAPSEDPPSEADRAALAALLRQPEPSATTPEETKSEEPPPPPPAAPDALDITPPPPPPEAATSSGRRGRGKADKA